MMFCYCYNKQPVLLIKQPKHSGLKPFYYHFKPLQFVFLLFLMFPCAY